MRVFNSSTHESQDPHRSMGIPVLLQQTVEPTHSAGSVLPFIYVFAVSCLGLHWCVWASSSCSERGLLLVAVHGLPVAVAFLVAPASMGSSQEQGSNLYW